MGRSERRKGYMGEYNLVKRLKEAGINAHRVPLSGADRNYKHVIIINGEPAEVKVRKDGFKNLYKWLEGVRYLFVKRDRKDYLVVMRLEDFIGMLKEWR